MRVVLAIGFVAFMLTALPVLVAIGGEDEASAADPTAQLVDDVCHDGIDVPHALAIKVFGRSVALERIEQRLALEGHSRRMHRPPER